MNISAIVAMTLNRVIGKENELPWYIPEDLKRVKKLTTGKTIVMGRKCFESIGKPLPDRENIVLTRQKDYAPEGVTVFNSFEELMIFLKSKDSDEEVVIFGGEQIYRLFIPYITKYYMTIVLLDIDGDTRLPKNYLKYGIWTQTEYSPKKDMDCDIDYYFNTIERGIPHDRM